jgi:hypothetical protein
MRLENYCTLPTDDLMKIIAMDDHAETDEGYVYINNNSDVLVVAHADVCGQIEDVPFFFEHEINTPTLKETRFYSPYLDDRLGVWVVMELLKELRINVDVLITTGEEMEMSTAEAFVKDTAKTWNWIAEFDRRGDDVVMYQYKNKQMVNQLKKAGFRIGLGSFSDICYMEDLGIACFNVGVGYEEEHSTYCWGTLEVLLKQLIKFEKFYWKNHGIKFEDTGVHYAYGNYGKYDWMDDDLTYEPPLHNDNPAYGYTQSTRKQLPSLAEALEAGDLTELDDNDFLFSIGEEEDEFSNNTAMCDEIYWRDQKKIRATKANLRVIADNDKRYEPLSVGL